MKSSFPKPSLPQRYPSGKINWPSTIHYFLDRFSWTSKLYRTPTGWWFVHWVLWRYNPFCGPCTECTHPKFAHEWSWGWDKGYEDLGKSYCRGNVGIPCGCGYHCGR